MIPLGDRLKPVINEREAEREAEADPTRADALSGEDYDDDNPAHRKEQVTQPLLA